MNSRVSLQIEMTAPRVIMQDLCKFSVQILDSLDAVIGTGIIISDKGHILTCEHVVYEAGINVKCKEGRFSNAAVDIYMPKPITTTERRHKAKVEACLFEAEDDIVVLKIIDSLKPCPWPKEQVARLGIAESSGGHKFRSYGFRRRGGCQSSWVGGEIRGTVLPPEDENWLVQPIELKPDIDVCPGMSGSGVLEDDQYHFIIGLITRRWTNSSPGERVAWAVDNFVLTKFNSASLEFINKCINLG
jgi:Trypsin-like peptidase domain